MHDIAQPEWAYLQHWRDEYPQTDVRDIFDIPGNRTSERMAKFADASRRGRQSIPHSASVVERLNGYFDRSMRTLMDKVERCQKHERAEKKIIQDGNDLLADIGSDLV